MKEVTDPTLLDQLNAKEVTDPRILSLLNEGKAPTAPDIQPGILASMASGAWQGAKNLASGVANIATLPARAPAQITADVMQLGQDPAGFASRKAGELGQFVKGLVPMQQTASDLLSGTVPSAEQVTREATEAAGGYALAKYAQPGAVKTGKAIVRGLPGSAVELNEMAAGKMRAIPEGIRPSPGAVEGTYAALDKLKAPNVFMENTQATAQRLLDKEMTLAQPDTAFVSTLKSFLDRTKGGLSFKEIQNNVVDLGEKIGQLQQSKGTKLGEMRDLFSALHEDAASGVPVRTIKGKATPSESVLASEATSAGITPPSPLMKPGEPTYVAGKPSAALEAKSQLWDSARGIARRNFASNDLTRMIEKSGISTVGDGFTQVNTNKLVSQIEDMVKLAGQDKRAKLFVESFRPGELEDISNTLKAIGKESPKIPAKAGTPVGSSQRLLAGSIGTLAGSALGGIAGHPWMGTAVGGPAGILASELIAKAMMSPTGRALVRHAVTPTGTISPQAAALIGAFIKSEGQEDTPGPPRLPKTRPGVSNVSTQ